MRAPQSYAGETSRFAYAPSGGTAAWSRPDNSAHAASLFKVGRNCFAVGRARRAALLVDGEAYFRNFVLAAERAQRSILVLSWEFNSTTRLHFNDERDGPPSRLGDFLNWLVRRRRGLHIHVLDWDFPLVFGADREWRPFYGYGWRPRRRVHIACDNTQPLSGSHHQKVVVIDDAMAFIGGFDLTVRRWDTCAHAAQDKRRMCLEKPYPPFHDMMMAVDGEPARALGQLARDRWHTATGHDLPPPIRLPTPWPSGLEPDFTDIDIALARTMPEIPGRRHGVAEVEKLYLDMIAAAREHIYIENQYFTSYRVGEALAARLQEPGGPEIVVAVRLFSHGWMEEHTMHVLRTRLVQRLRSVDTYGRFHIYYPHIDGLDKGLCIDLHSKLMIVDDDILRVGSANLSNRSMGMDTECDAALEARGDTAVRTAIRGFRNRLLAEHLDVEPEAVERAIRAYGSLHEAIDALAGKARTLRRLDQLPEWSDAVIELASVGDPGKPVSFDTLIDEFSPEQFAGEAPAVQDPAASRSSLRQRVLRIGAIVGVIAGLAALWRYTPLAEWVNPDQVTSVAREFGDRAWAPLIVLAAYTPACLLMFPRPLITLGAVVAFGPLLGFAYSVGGVLIAALVTYLAGFLLPRETIHSLGGNRLMHLADVLRRRSLIAMTAIRLVPIAPFAVAGPVAATIGVPLVPYMLGTFFGMLPGTLATTVFGDQLEAVLNDPSRINYGLLAGAVVLVVAASLTVRRWLVTQHRRHAAAKNEGPTTETPHAGNRTR